MRVGRSFSLTAALCLAAAAAGVAIDRPLTVSPGGLAAVDAAPTACPTFSWGGVEKARGYELVVYEMATAQSPENMPGEEPALSVTVPGSASSWTPAADRCLAAATTYAWFLRALGRHDAVSEWSTGAMFRTPAAIAPNALRDQVLKIVERYLAASSGGVGTQPLAGSNGPATDARVAESSAIPCSKRPTTREPDPTDLVAFRAEHPATTGDTTIGVYGISNSNEHKSAGVAGHASAATGETYGVVGSSESDNGTGVYGQNEASSGGVGVLGRDEATSGVTAGVVGLTVNPGGYAGFFWNEATTGDRVALIVAEPIGDPPTSFDVKFTVDVDGNLELVGVAKFDPKDLPATACDGTAEGSVYYDDSVAWLCICTQTGPGTWEFRRADDPTTGCL